MALFINVYGADTLRNSTYPTKDGCIPFKLFFFLMNCLQPVKAFQILGDVQAVTLGNAQVQASKKEQHKIQRVMKDYYNQAFGRD